MILFQFPVYVGLLGSVKMTVGLLDCPRSKFFFFQFTDCRHWIQGRSMTCFCRFVMLSVLTDYVQVLMMIFLHHTRIEIQGQDVLWETEGAL